MRSRLTTSAAAVLALTLGALTLTGCSEAEDAVRGAASTAASQAASQIASDLADIPKNVARDQLCKIADDGQVSTSESALLSGAVAAAEKAGVDQQVIDAARDLAAQGTAAPRDAVDNLKRQCEAAPSSAATAP